jgi:small subunit ribosomal protein S8
MVTDPVSDMFTRIRNATLRKMAEVNVPASGFKKRIADILKEEGYIKDFKMIDDEKSGVIRIYLKYSTRGESVITNIARVSKPGRKVYRKTDNLGKVMDGLGISIVSTPKGLMTDNECRKLNLGGEIIARVR